MSMFIVHDVYAIKIDLDAAIQTAIAFKQTRATRSNPKIPTVQLISPNSYVSEETEDFYIFNYEDNDGYVIVGGDDMLPSILGYSDSGNIDLDNLPPALEWKLNSFKEEISYILKSDKNEFIGNKYARNENGGKHNIEPLLTTKWGQGAPYNNLCPELNGLKCPTGCVATATAQIINYHKWPDNGMGEFSYSWNDKTLSYDFSTSRFNWDEMLNSYNEEYTTKNAESIAELMYACGIGLEMGYNPSGSGSHISRVIRLLIDNFKYDPNISLKYKNNYSLEEWINIHYEELLNNRPIYCEGGGHAFVCDGYAGNNYFHFNWGWDGFADGNFLLSALQPDSSDKFHQDEFILTGIQKNKSDNRSYSVDLICKQDFRVNDSGMLEINGLFNYSYNDFVGYFGVNIVSESTGESMYFKCSNEEKLNHIDLQGPFAIISSSNVEFYGPAYISTPGLYKVYPVYKTEYSDWRSIKCFYGINDFVFLNVNSDGSYNYYNSAPIFMPSIHVEQFGINIGMPQFPEGVAYAKESLHYYMVFCNDSDTPCFSNINMLFFKEGELVFKKNGICSLESFERQGIAIEVALHEYIFDEGEYEIKCYDDYGNLLNQERLLFTIFPEIIPDLYLLDFEVGESNDVFQQFKIKIKNNSEIYCNKPIKYCIIDRNGNIIYENTLFWFLDGLSTTEIPIYIDKLWYEFTPGDYKLLVYDSQEKLIHADPILFSISDSSSIRNIITNSSIDSSEYYNLQGQRVKNPDKGIYILKRGNITKKVIIH